MLFYPPWKCCKDDVSWGKMEIYVFAVIFCCVYRIFSYFLNSYKEFYILQETMDTSAKSQFSSKTFKDQHGNFPKWMSRTKIEKLKKKAAKKKKPSKK